MPHPRCTAVSGSSVAHLTLVKPEPDPEYERLYGPGTITIPHPEFKEHIAHIISYDSNSDRCLVGNTWPTFEDQSLDALIRRLVVKGEKPKYDGVTQWNF